RQSLLRSLYVLLGVVLVTLSAGSHQRSFFVAVDADHVDGRAEGACDRTSAVHRALGGVGAISADDDRSPVLHLAPLQSPSEPRSVTNGRSRVDLPNLHPGGLGGGDFLVRLVVQKMRLAAPLCGRANARADHASPPGIPTTH